MRHSEVADGAVLDLEDVALAQLQAQQVLRRASRATGHELGVHYLVALVRLQRQLGLPACRVFHVQAAGVRQQQQAVL